MINEINPDNAIATVTYDSFTRMSSESLFGATGTVSITPAQEAGLVAAGGTTPLVYPSNYVGTVTDADRRDDFGDVRQPGRHHLRDRRPRATPPRSPETARTCPRHGHRPARPHDDVSHTTRQETSPRSPRLTAPPRTILYNDSFGIPTHVVDFDGNVTTYTLDSHGNVTQRTDPDGQSENYTYNSAGQVLTDTDPLGKTTSLYAMTASAA